MPLPTFTPPIGPSPGKTIKPQISLREAEFGDGYSQNTPKGLNHIRQNVDLKWSGLTKSEFQTIVAFFTLMGGYLPFYYQVYGDIKVRKWVCKEWSGGDTDGVFTLSATFLESFTLEV